MNLNLNSITAMFSMVRSKMTVGEPILDVPPSNLPPPCIRIRRVTSTVGLAHWTLTCDLWPLWYSYRGHEAAACVDSREHAEGAPRALYAGRHCVSTHTQTHSKYVTDAGWCSGKHTRAVDTLVINEALCVRCRIAEVKEAESHHTPWCKYLASDKIIIALVKV